MEKLIIIRWQILFQEQSGCNKFRFEELIGRYKFNNHVETCKAFIEDNQEEQ